MPIKWENVRGCIKTHEESFVKHLSHFFFFGEGGGKGCGVTFWLTSPLPHVTQVRFFLPNPLPLPTPTTFKKIKDVYYVQSKSSTSTSIYRLNDQTKGDRMIAYSNLSHYRCWCLLSFTFCSFCCIFDLTKQKVVQNISVEIKSLSLTHFLATHFLLIITSDPACKIPSNHCFAKGGVHHRILPARRGNENISQDHFDHSYGWKGICYVAGCQTDKLRKCES